MTHLRWRSLTVSCDFCTPRHNQKGGRCQWGLFRQLLELKQKFEDIHRTLMLNLVQVQVVVFRKKTEEEALLSPEKVFPRSSLPKFSAKFGWTFWVEFLLEPFVLWVEGPNSSENSWEGFRWFFAIERLLGPQLYIHNKRWVWIHPQQMRPGTTPQTSSQQDSRSPP